MTTLALDDTIAAIATAPGGAARGIVRISGSGVLRSLSECFDPDSREDLKTISSATVVSGMLTLPNLAAPLPCKLYLWPDTRSYTREPVAELHTIGSPPLLEATLRAVCKSGARVAEPGEFTLRAFLAGRMDLTQAEAVLGVIDATGDTELQIALAQLAGGIAGPLTELRDSLLDLLAHLEAGLDFVEEDIEFIAAEQLDRQLSWAATTIDDLAARMKARGEVRDVVRIVLTGWPNVGKSSLLNALAGRETAIVSQLAGTTRDYVTAQLSLDGVACELIDTAGVEREAAGEGVAASAQQMMREQSERAQVRILCLDASRPLNRWEQEQLQPDYSPLVALTKCDLPRGIELGSHSAIETSAQEQSGIDQLRIAIREAALAAHQEDSDVVAGTAVRCRESLRLAAQTLTEARQLSTDGGGQELVAALIRSALDELGKVVGAVYTDDVLDRIFSRFCIGK